MGVYKYIILAGVGIILAYEVTRITNMDYVYPEIGYSPKEFVESLGYSFEYHSVVTTDGYILDVHHIPSPNPKSGLPPVFLMHCLLCSSLNWLSIGHKSLPIYLASQGYDIWLGNARGNVFSRNHLTINPDINPEKFFDFSWHEIGSIDVPTMIDYVLNQTKFEKLTYIGHSQGTITFFVMMSQKPDYNKKVQVMIALAPVVYTSGIRAWAFTVPAKIQGLLEWLMPRLGTHELLPQTKRLSYLENAYCRDGAFMQSYCHILLGTLGGFNPDGLNATLLPLIYSHMPSGSAMKQLLHYTQVLNSDIFRQYDHGKEENIQRYGRSSPPQYYLKSTTVPVAIFWSVNDFVTSERNIGKLQDELTNVILKFKMPDSKFSHFDFLMSHTAELVLYPKVLDTIEIYSNITMNKRS